MVEKSTYTFDCSLILITSFLPAKVMATKWLYPFVVWDGYIYEVTEEPVTVIGDKIGKVTNYSDMEQQSGNFSNAYPKGTKYYAIKCISSEKSIAVQESEKQYVKADRKEKYEFEQAFDEPKDIGRGIIFSIVGIFVVIFIYKLVKNRLDKR